MPDYQRGKIYKITSGDTTYIGSTCEQTLAKRLAGHVQGYKCWKNGKQNFISSYLLIETEEYEITLIELYPCDSRDELRSRERFHIETNDCVNKNIPGRSHKEYIQSYYKENIEKIKEKVKIYANDNKDTIKENQKVYREDNRDKKREYYKAWLEANSIKKKDKDKEYYQANRDKILEKKATKLLQSRNTL